MTKILLKRIYEPKEASDGFRILADRLWPRGISKENAATNLWAKNIAPSNDLRKWYHAHMDKYDEFFQKYTAELDENPDTAVFLKTVRSKSVICLLTAAKEVPKSQLGILKDYIEKNKIFSSF